MSTYAMSSQVELVDDAGTELCLKFHRCQRGRCRFGKECHRSHEAPSASALAPLCALRDAREAAEAAASAAAAERRRAVAAEAAAADVPDWLQRARRELHFDASSGGALARMVAAAVEFLGAGTVGLDALHALAPTGEVPACPTLISAHKRAGRALPTTWKAALLKQARTLKRLKLTPAYRAWLGAYRDFVRDVVAPLCGDDTGIAFQCPPTLRVVFPGAAGLGEHVDADYDRHEASEINFWIPLTAVDARNTLFFADGRRPVELSVGEGLRFNGQQRAHFARSTPDGRTRVSFDLRCIPLSLFRDAHGGKMGDYPIEVLRRC